MVKISIIIPICNSEKFLKEAIDSVASQSFKDIEIICIGSGSNSMLESLSEKYDFLRIVHQKDQCYDKARNYGINEAKGDYVSFLDADDIFVDEKSLELLYDAANKNDADVVCGNLKKLSEDRILLDNPDYSEGNYFYFDEYSTIGPKEYGIPWAFHKNIYKKSFLEKNNIRFKDLIKGQGPVFLAETLTKSDVICGVPVDFYASSFPVPEKPYSSINTHDKKLHYITHYKCVFDIFTKVGLNQSYESYKSKFIKYLNYSIRSKNLAIFELVREVFGKDNDYFADFQEDYDYFNAFHILNKLAVENSSDYFMQAQDELKGIDVSNNKKMPKRLLENVELLNSSTSFEEYMDKSHELNLKYIEAEIEGSNKINKQRKENLEYRKKLFNRKFSLFIVKYNQLSGKSRLDYYNDLKKDFIQIKKHDRYRHFILHFNEFNRNFFEKVINSKSFEEFELFFETLKLENQNRSFEKKFNNLINEIKKS